MMLLLCVILTICVIQIESLTMIINKKSSSKTINHDFDDHSVLGVEDLHRNTYICLDQYTCRIADIKSDVEDCPKVSNPPGVGYFKYTGKLCKDNTTMSTVVVPPYIKSSYIESHVRDRGNSEIKSCRSKSKKCLVKFNYTGQPINEEKKSTSEKESSGENKSGYFIGGVAVILLIVVLQTACIIMYKRKVAKTRKTLHNILCRREEDNEEKVRYSAGPDLRKNSKMDIDADDDIYESLENIRQKNAKDKKDINKTWSASSHSSSRPRLPLPFEAQARACQSTRDLNKTWSPNHNNARWPSPIPLKLQETYSQEISSPLAASKTRLMESRQNSVDRRIKPSLSKQVSVNSLTRKEKPLPPPPDRPRPEVRPKPHVTRNPIALELNQMIMKNNQQQAASNNIPMQVLNQPTMNQLPMNQSPLNPFLMNQSPLKNSTFNQPPMNRSTMNQSSMNPLTSNKTRQDNQTPPLGHVQRQDFQPQSQTNIRPDSDYSDEEWTYEKLHPMQKYLH